MGSGRRTFCRGAVVAAVLTSMACPVTYAVGGEDSGNGGIGRSSGISRVSGISVTPSPPAPGSDIQVRAQGCTGRTGTASSRAFVADARLTGSVGGDGAFIGETRVRSSLTPGTYLVKVTCDGAEDNSQPHNSQPHNSQPHNSQPHNSQPHNSQPHNSRSQPHSQSHSPSSSHSPSHASVKAELTVAEKAGEPWRSAAPGTHASPVAPLRAGGGGAAHLVAAEAREVAAETRNPGARDEGPGARQAMVGLVLVGVAALAVILRGARRSHGRK